jgi:YidC/Oxa1 family membrane protein insertase
LGAVILFIWNQILLGPSTNFIVALDRVFFGSYGLAIIVFTLLLRGVTLPLTLKQMQSSKKMQQLQPEMQRIQKQYSDPKRRSEEQMKLYKEAGVNPLGCVVPMLIQFPIWIALYQVIRITLATTPESLIDLSHRLYPWSFVQHAVPLASHFLWLNLGQPDKTLIMPILVFATMWLQQKLTMTQQTMVAGSQSAQTNQMMLWIMPLMFAYFSWTLPSGLSLYWVITNVAGIALNYYIFEWHTKPLHELWGGGGFSLGTLLGSGQRRTPAGARVPQRPSGGGRPAPQRSPRRDDAGGGRSGAEAPSKATGQTAELPPIAPPGNGTNGRQRRRSSQPPGRSQPKAPPVSRPAPRATGRLSDDPAVDNDGPETRSSNGTGT